MNVATPSSGACPNQRFFDFLIRGKFQARASGVVRSAARANFRPCLSLLCLEDFTHDFSCAAIPECQ
jgi:hypothetical protein